MCEVEHRINAMAVHCPSTDSHVEVTRKRKIHPTEGNKEFDFLVRIFGAFLGKFLRIFVEIRSL